MTVFSYELKVKKSINYADCAKKFKVSFVLDAVQLVKNFKVAFLKNKMNVRRKVLQRGSSSFHFDVKETFLNERFQ